MATKKLIDDVRDVMHLYIGSKHQWQDEDGKWSTMEPLVIEKCAYIINEWIQVRLVLRRIESMTEEEAIAIGEIVIGTYDSVRFRVEKNFSSSGRFTYWKVHKEHRGYGKSLTIDQNGEIDVYDKHDDGTHTIYTNQHFVTMFLLSRGFDLYQLIDSIILILVVF